MSPPPRPEIICLCGSSRFISEIAVIAWGLEKDGNIVLGLHLLPPGYSPGVADHQAEAERARHRPDEPAREAVGMAIEGSGLEALEGTARDSRQDRQVIERDSAQEPLPGQIAADRLYRSSFRYSSDFLPHGPLVAWDTAVTRWPTARSR